MGQLTSISGTGVMAFWGAPDNPPDHAKRACRAAQAIAAALHKDNARRRAKGLGEVCIRIGIVTGRVLVGNIGAPGRINYTLVGDAVNLAQRLEELGKEIEGAGEVIALVTEDSHACLGPNSDAVPIGPRQVKNRDGEIGVYRLV